MGCLLSLIGWFYRFPGIPAEISILVVVGKASPDFYGSLCAGHALCIACCFALGYGVDADVFRDGRHMS